MTPLVDALPRPPQADRRRAELDRLTAGLVGKLAASPLGLAGLSGALDEDEWLEALVEQVLLHDTAGLAAERPADSRTA